MTSSQSSSSSKLSFKNTSLYCLIWALVALAFTILGQSIMPTEKPLWYQIGNIVIEEGAFLFAAYLCWRNWLCSRLLSDRQIWLFFSLGLAMQAISNFIYYGWELILKSDPELSIAHLSYLISYLFLLAGIVQAVKFRRLELSIWQWIVWLEIFLGAVWLAWIVANPNFQAETSIPGSGNASANLPAWASAIESSMAPIVDYINLSIVAIDVILLTLAMALLITFWGGRFSQTWLAIAIGAILLYIADTWYAYMVAITSNIPSGLNNVMWTLSAIGFALGATWEYETSTRPRRR
jgi:hypothetical protein